VSSPRTLVIIVNWNKAAVLETMLRSLESSGPREFDAVLIDNASTDNSIAMVRETFPWVQIVHNTENLGGTGGFNTGLRYGLKHPNNYEFLWLLDNDVIVHEGAYRELLQVMDQDPKTGLVGSCILLMDDPTRVQECGGLLEWNTGRLLRGYEGNVSEMPDRIIDVDFSAACSLLARLIAVREVGIRDPNYFLLRDDVERGVRMNRAGWKVKAAPRSRVQHESYNNRRGQASAISSYLAVRNGLYFNSRFAPPEHFRSNLYFQLRTALGFAENFCASGRTEEAAIIERAIADFAANRMGRPPTDLKSRANDDRATEVKLPPARRIAVLCRDNPELTNTLHALVRSKFPRAQVDTVVLHDTPELRESNLPNERVLDASSRTGRLRIARIFATRYDLVVAPDFMQEFFFERCAPYSARYVAATREWRVRKRSLRTFATTLWRRLFLPMRVHRIIARAKHIRNLQVNYHEGVM
jgi:GT2 family glycosyltransferase